MERSLLGDVYWRVRAVGREMSVLESKDVIVVSEELERNYYEKQNSTVAAGEYLLEGKGCWKGKCLY